MSKTKLFLAEQILHDFDAEISIHTYKLNVKSKNKFLIVRPITFR